MSKPPTPPAPTGTTPDKPPGTPTAPAAGGRGARFATEMDPAASALNASIAFDRRLLRDDVRGSQAHARMLAAVGLISSEDARTIVEGLEQAAQEIEAGKVVLRASLEDIHMNLEARLTELAGEPGRRLHTGRSRNDQVATDLRLYARRACADIVAGIDRARLAFCRRAREHAGTLLPGYTHLQRAQVVTLGHHLLAYAQMLGRDRGRFLDAARRADESPLGAGALAGTGLPIDRAATAASLGFSRPTANSLDTVSDRDFATEIAAACALLGVHLSRLGEELVLWSSTEFGFVRLGEGYCSGSSLMPQKRNPDIAELLRGKPGRLVGDLVALLTVTKGLALSYNKDLQETQEPFYDAVETTLASLAVLPGLVATLDFDLPRMRAAAEDPALGATDLAEHLVREKGVPFRRAHEIVGAFVRAAEARGVSLRAYPAAELAAVAPELDAASLSALDPDRAVAARNLPGGPAPAQVEARLAELEAELRALGFEV